MTQSDRRQSAGTLARLGSLLRGIARGVDALAKATAYLGGGLFLLTAFYITLDVLARRFVGVSSGMADEFSGYALAAGGLWTLAYTLKTGRHVRVDILLPYLPRRVRGALDCAALLLMALFALLLSIYSWRLVRESYIMEARAVSFVRTPLAAPQSFLASGFTILTLEAVVMLGRRFVDWLGGAPSEASAETDTPPQP